MALLATLVLGFANSYADQAIYVDMLDFIPEESEYILDDKERELKLKEVKRDFLGQVWRIVGDKDGAKDALGDKAMDAPGDNDFNSFIELTFEFEVKAGENGPWAMWARLNRLPDPNSWFYRTSQDGKKWAPPNFDVGAAGWNNPPGFGAAPEVLQFATGVLVDAKGPWFWFKGGGNPDLKAGKNFLNISPRESGLPPNNHSIDMISIRNDGNDPTDAEATPFISDGKFLKKLQAVDAKDKLTTTWGKIKSSR